MLREVLPQVPSQARRQGQNRHLLPFRLMKNVRPHLRTTVCQLKAHLRQHQLALPLCDLMGKQTHHQQQSTPIDRPADLWNSKTLPTVVRPILPHLTVLTFPFTLSPTLPHEATVTDTVVQKIRTSPQPLLPLPTLFPLPHLPPPPSNMEHWAIPQHPTIKPVVVPAELTNWQMQYSACLATEACYSH